MHEIMGCHVGDVRRVHIGVDIGQKHDPTAIVVCQVMERLGREIPQSPHPTKQVLEAHVLTRRATITPRVIETFYESRFIERLPLMTGYPQVAERIAELATSPALSGYSIQLLVDCTGVGQPVYEMVHNAVSLVSGGGGKYTPNIRMRAIMFTHGDRYERQRGLLGKAYLVSRLQALFQTRSIKLPPHHQEAQAMMRELKDYEIKIDQNGKDTYGAFSTGAHDDLATALGLAVLDDPHDYRVGIGPRLF
jgi:hypothetical protein